MSEWQPIRTAPLSPPNGLLGWSDEDGVFTMREYGGSSWIFVCGSRGGPILDGDHYEKPVFVKPTHWQPLPDPPL
jgi:hypothetical protein